MVMVMVGQEHMGDLDVLRVGGLEQRPPGPPASTKKPAPPGRAATRYVFDSQSGCIERSTIIGGSLEDR